MLPLLLPLLLPAVEAFSIMPMPMPMMPMIAPPHHFSNADLPQQQQAVVVAEPAERSSSSTAGHAVVHITEENEVTAAQHAHAHAPPSSSSSSHHYLAQGVRAYLSNQNRNRNLVSPAYAADTPNYNTHSMTTFAIADTATATSAAATTSAAPAPPTPDEITLLRSALASFYGQPRDSTAALTQLTSAIQAWKRQPPDERAALYRVRGDVEMDLKLPEKAAEDYATAISLLEGPGGERADEGELPAARLGRARAARGAFLSGAKVFTEQEWTSEAQDYQVALRLSSRDAYLDSAEEKEADGTQRNPYAGWEWGMALRNAGLYEEASETHTLAALAFRDIGDRARSVVSELDAGIDLAAAAGGSGDKNYRDAKELLEKAIPKTTGITSGTDVELLQRVIAKEGEARIALAALLWNVGD